MATQTESPRAAPATTVEVQVNLVNKKKVTIATQTEELENEWVSEPDTEQPVNELGNDHEMLLCICALSTGYRVGNPPRDQAQATEPPSRVGTAKKKKRRGKKHSEKGTNSVYM